MNENVQMACLPETISSEYPDTNSNAYIIGWGSTDSKATTDTSSYYLKNGKIKVFPEKDCLSVAMSYQKIWNAQICAGIQDYFTLELDTFKLNCLKSSYRR